MADPTSQGPGAAGIALFKAGEVDKAIPELRQAVHESPDSFELRMFFGLALAKKEKWADAESQFGTAFDLNSKSAEAAYFQGVAILKRGRRLEANSMFKVALALNPDHKGAQAGVEATADAAENIVTSGSSARMPGGANLTVGDWTQIEEEAARLEGKAVPPRKAPDEVASALAELDPNAGRSAGGRAPAKSGGKPGGKPAPKSTGPTIKTPKKGGCMGSLVALGLLGMVVLLGLASLVAAIL